MFKFITVICLVLILAGCASQKPYTGVMPVSKISARESIDMRGKSITTFILFNAVEKLKNMKEGEVLEIITENYEPIENDMKAWTRMTGYKLVELEKKAEYERFYIEKVIPVKKDKKIAFVISNPGLEELISPLGFALGAELSGMDVYIFFQGPAVRVLKKGFTEKLGGINCFFSVFAREGLAEIGHIPPQDKLKQLKDLGAHFYACGPSMEHFGTDKSDLIFDDVTIAEYLTFLEVMEKADIHIYLQ